MVAHNLEALLLHHRGIFHVLLFSSYQEGAKEDEGDKVEIGKVRATASLMFSRKRWVHLALLPSQT